MSPVFVRGFFVRTGSYGQSNWVKRSTEAVPIGEWLFANSVLPNTISTFNHRIKRKIHWESAQQFFGNDAYFKFIIAQSIEYLYGGVMNIKIKI